MTIDEITSEQYLASAINYLMHQGKKEAANLLISCSAEIEVWNNDDHTVILRGSPEFYSRYNAEPYNKDSALVEAIYAAFWAVLPPTNHLEIQVRVFLLEIDTDWRTRLLAESETQEVDNQNPYEKRALVWNGMRFSSPPEIAIAKALEKTGALYFPNALARVGPKGSRNTRIPDFLICFEGKWGILEVDGSKYHTPSNATADHNRTRQFRSHGINCIDRYDARRCSEQPDAVVKEFLTLLQKA